MRIDLKYAVIGGIAFTLWGCGGGGSSPLSAGNALLQGRAALNNMSSGQQPATAATLQSALALFQQALQQQPGDPQANFGAAVCAAGLIGQEMDGFAAMTSGSTGSGSGSAPGSAPPGNYPPAPSPPAPPTTAGVTVTSGPLPPEPPGTNGDPMPTIPPHQAGLLWNLGTDISNPYQLLHMMAPIADLRFGMMPFYGYASDNPAGREQMLTTLNSVSAELQTIEATPNFSATLSLYNGQTAVVGLPEVYLFDAYVNSLRVEVSLSLAYIRSEGVSGAGGAPTPMLLVNQPMPPTDLNGDGKLEPNEYLPPSPFLTLRDPSFITTAQQALAAVADREAKGIAGVLARPSDGSGGFLVPNSTANNQILTQIQNSVLPILQQSVTGPVTIQVPVPTPFWLPAPFEVGTQVQVVPGSFFAAPVFVGDLSENTGSSQTTQPVSVAVTFNLSAWFSHPPADLKAFAPTYPIGSNGQPELNMAVYPDPTFGGLFPNGLPSQLLF